MSASIATRLASPGPKRMLALDGGGARGMISIGFLEAIEKRLRKRHGRDDYVLSDYFDMIGGTSVGSILATMLALGWPMQKVRAEFERLCPDIFGKRVSLTGAVWAKFSDKALSNGLTETLGDMRLDSDELKTGLAIVTKRLDTGSPWTIYNNPHSSYWAPTGGIAMVGNCEYRLADLIRASTAAPTYFRPHEIKVRRWAAKDPGSGLFVDGGLSPYNNPALLMFMMAGISGYRLGGVESQRQADGQLSERGIPWKLGRNNLLIVSIGTGSFRVRVKSKGWIAALLGGRALLGMMADSQGMNLKMLQWLGNPRRRWKIDGEVGDMLGDDLGELVGGEKSLLSFNRYDVVLENEWLEHELDGRRFSDDQLTALQQLDNAKNLATYYDLGEAAAGKQVSDDDFPWQFDTHRLGASMFEIVRIGGASGPARLLAPQGLVAGDFDKIAKALKTKPFRARKSGFVAARQATAEEHIVTQWNGAETEKTAKPGDWIVANLTPKKDVIRDSEGHANIYVIDRDKFGQLYAPDRGKNEFGAIHRAIGTVDAIYFPGGFDILAPWGQPQIADSGYLLRNGDEMYGNAKETFETTYKKA